jgi:hypothetical protein
MDYVQADRLRRKVAMEMARVFESPALLCKCAVGAGLAPAPTHRPLSTGWCISVQGGVILGNG